ncbi:COG1470 family protein [Phytohabitans suffuscus]|nr:hypothetical protein [Phytohabitans suffuscus]
MSPLMTLSTTSLSVNPGETVTCELRIRNSGQVVDQFRLEPLGTVAKWLTVEPELLNLFPGEEGSAVLTLNPPRSPDVPAGPTPFAVRASSREAPEWSETVEGSVEVAPFTDTTAWLHPRTLRRGRRGTFRLYVDNRGNRSIESELAALDVDNLLTFALRERRVVTAPGTASVVKLRAKVRKTFAKGADQLRPFQVLIRLGEEEPITADGALKQRQLLPTWLVPALAVTAAAAMAFAVLWFTTLRPVLNSAARAEERAEALAEEVESVKQEAQRAGERAEQAQRAAQSGSDGAGTGTGTNASLAPGPGTGDAGAAPPGTEPYDFRIAGNAAVAGGFHTTSFTVPAGRILMVTDIVLQNPRGDSGLLRVQRGSTVLLETGLENFRDLDYHFVEPLSFSAGQKVTLAVDCTNGGDVECTPAVYFSGQLRPGPSPTPSGR